MGKKDNHQLSRRSFLKWGAATAALSTGLTGCSKSNSDNVITGGGNGIMDKPAAELSGGKWITIPCAECSTSRCVNRAYMVDGMPIRQKTDDSHPFSDDYPQYRACLKGRGMRWYIYNPVRLKYPMKRKNWDPGGARNTHLRGRDEWVRISWKEALDLSYKEIKRIVETYGGTPSQVVREIGAAGGVGVMGAWGSNPTGAISIGYGDTANMPILNLTYTAGREPRFLNSLGYGTVPIWGQNSTGAWPVVTNLMLGSTPDFGDRLNIQNNSKLIVLWGQNPAWVKYGIAQHTYKRAKERGAKIICVDPWLNPGNSTLVDEWIPVRSGTDTALLLAVAYELIKNNLIDQEFLNNNVAGFDAEHMPLHQADGLTPITDHAGESVIEIADGVPRHRYYKNNFKDYVLGTYDGVPKTPEWATGICGTPVEKIRILAQAMGEIKPMALLASNAPARTYQGATFVQAFYSVGWMTGNVGKPGTRIDCAGNAQFGGNSYNGAYGSFYDETNGYNFRQGTTYTGLPARVTPPASTLPPPENPRAERSYGSQGFAWQLHKSYDQNRYYGIAFAEVWDAILNQKHHDLANGIKPLNIRAVLKTQNTNCVNQVVNTNKAIRALRSEQIEFFLSADREMSSTSRYADIVLPCTTWWEDDGHYNMLNPEIFIGYPDKIIEPLFEAKSSEWIEAELAERFGVPREDVYVNGLPLKQRVFNTFANTYVRMPDGQNWEPLMSFTADDINELGVAASPLPQGRITYKEFKERGFYQVRMNESMLNTGGLTLAGGALATYSYTANGSTIVNELLDTETGKLEIYSMNLSKYYDNFGFTSLDPIAKYVPSKRGYEESQNGTNEMVDNVQINDVFPYQMINTHPHNRLHSARTDNPNVLEVFDDVLWINPIDAEKQGLSNGDTALITSPAGRILRRVAVTSTVIPGMVISTEGMTTRFNEDETIDLAGNPNVLSESLLCGEGHQAYNTAIVKMEKWSGTPLIPQYKWAPDTVEFSEKSN